MPDLMQWALSIVALFVHLATAHHVPDWVLDWRVTTADYVCLRCVAEWSRG